MKRFLIGMGGILVAASMLAASGCEWNHRDDDRRYSRRDDPGYYRYDNRYERNGPGYYGYDNRYERNDRPGDRDSDGHGGSR